MRRASAGTGTFAPTAAIFPSRRMTVAFSIIGPLIVVVCFIGAWTVGASKPDLWIAAIFGVVGYVFKKLDYPLAPMVLADGP